MGSKTQRKPEKRSATKPRVAVAPGTRKVSPRKASKPTKPAKKAAPKKAAKKAPAKKAAARKAPPRKAAPKKPVKKAAAKQPAKKAAPKKAPPKPVKKAAPPAKKAAVKAPAKAPAKAVAPPAKKAAAPAKAPAKAAAPAKTAVEKSAATVKVASVKAAPSAKAAPAKTPAVKAEAPVKAAKPEAPAKPPKAPKPVKEAAPEAEAPAATVLDADAVPAEIDEFVAAAPVAPRHGAPPMGPRKRGRKRRDPLDDLLKPDKQKRRPGRPRKRGPLGELVPKRGARLRKRIRGRRSGEDDMDLPVTPRPPAPRDTMSPAEIRADVIAKYLRGETPTCPVGCGGLAQVVRIATGANGAGEVWFECLSCAQREKFEVPAPSPEERDAVFAVLEAGNEPLCKRHNGRWVQLRRRGRDLVCPECGILIQGR